MKPSSSYSDLIDQIKSKLPPHIEICGTWENSNGNIKVYMEDFDIPQEGTDDYHFRDSWKKASEKSEKTIKYVLSPLLEGVPHTFHFDVLGEMYMPTGHDLILGEENA